MIRAPRTWTLVALLALALLAALLAAAGTIAYVAYDRQSDEVAQLRTRDAKLESDHAAIGAKFAQQSQELEEAVAAVNRAYGRGFQAGRKAEQLPRAFTALWLSVQRGFLVPVSVPSELRGQLRAVRQYPRGYTIRWRGVALFASSRTPLSDWTAQAWPGSARTVRVAGRAVKRMTGPFGVVFAWRARDKTYAVVALPRTERLVAPLVETLR